MGTPGLNDKHDRFFGSPLRFVFPIFFKKKTAREPKKILFFFFIPGGPP